VFIELFDKKFEEMGVYEGKQTMLPNFFDALSELERTRFTGRRMLWQDSCLRILRTFTFGPAAGAFNARNPVRLEEVLEQAAIIELDQELPKPLRVFLSEILLWPLLLVEIVKEARKNTPENIREFGRKLRAQEVGKGWLRNRITVEEAEAKHMSDLGLGDNVSETVRRARLEFARSRGVPVTGKPIPFGLLYCEWREMVRSMQAGDELWEYRSSEHSWKHMAGRAGIALVRRGEVVDAITMSMN